MKTKKALCALVPALAFMGCGTEFDSISQLSGLRILGVQKSSPYAKPGQEVELEMLYHDASDEKRDVELLWISGCENPPGDLYAICFEALGPALRGELPPGAGAADAPSAPLGGEDVDPDELLRAGVAARAERVSIGPGFAFGFQETFTLEVNKDVISSRPPPADPMSPAYGLNYVFFAACAGELHLDLDADFPLVCWDEDGDPLGAKDFIVGYSAVYSYEEESNANPVFEGVEVEGKKLDRDDICIGSECGILETDSDRECNDSDPVVEACEDEDSGDCPTLEIRALVDPDSVEDNGILSIAQGSPVQEQMWLNYHSDRGEFTNAVALVNDTATGFNPDTETEFVAPEKKGPAQIWVVVRDNRGGTDWGRFQICVE